MNCLVCGKPHIDEEDCMTCGFPIVNIPMPFEDGIKMLIPTIEAFRKSFSKKLTVGVIIHYWKTNNNKIEYDRSEKIPFGRYSDLLGKTQWLDTEFDNISKRDSVETCIYTQLTDDPDTPIISEIVVNTPTPHEGEIDYLGITAEEDFTFTLTVRTNSGAKSISESTALFQ